MWFLIGADKVASGSFSLKVIKDVKRIEWNLKEHNHWFWGKGF